MNSLHSVDCKNLDKARETKKDLEAKLNSTLSNIININIENAILTDQLALKSTNLKDLKQTNRSMKIENESLFSKSYFMEIRCKEELAGKLNLIAKMDQLQQLVSHF